MRVRRSHILWDGDIRGKCQCPSSPVAKMLHIGQTVEQPKQSQQKQREHNPLQSEVSYNFLRLLSWNIISNAMEWRSNFTVLTLPNRSWCATTVDIIPTQQTDHNLFLQVRNVKWLQRITVADDESDSHWQRYDYKVSSVTIGYCDTVGEWQKYHNKRFVTISEPFTVLLDRYNVVVSMLKDCHNKKFVKISYYWVSIQ